MEVKEGKWRTRGGEVVDVVRLSDEKKTLDRWWKFETASGWWFPLPSGRIHGPQLDHDNDLIAPVHEITPGSEWVISFDGGHASVFVIGRAKGGQWAVEFRHGGTQPWLVNEDAFLEPWTDPPKPRTWTRYIVICKHFGCGANTLAFTLAFDDRARAESARERISDVVEVTLTEEVKNNA